MVEVIVALLVLAVGLVCTVSAFAATARTFEYGHSSVAATAQAMELLESARVQSCSGARAGAVIEGEGTFYWTTEEAGADMRVITVVFSPRTLRSRADTFSAPMPC